MKVPIYARVDSRLKSRLKKEALRLKLPFEDLVEISLREALPIIQKSTGIHLTVPKEEDPPNEAV